MAIGTDMFVTEAKRTRKILGGGMRQVGILAVKTHLNLRLLGAIRGLVGLLEATRTRKILGGGIRQVGILAVKTTHPTHPGLIAHVIFILMINSNNPNNHEHR